MRLVAMLASLEGVVQHGGLTSPALYKGGSAYVLAHPVVGYGGGPKALALEGREMNVEVRNNPAKQRYELWVDGERVGHALYSLGNGRIAFVHTKVYEPHERLGLGTQLARVALDDARARGLMVMPFCQFIADFIERHLDEYGDLVAPEMLTGERP